MRTFGMNPFSIPARMPDMKPATEQLNVIKLSANQKPVDTVLTDLAELWPEDAAVFRAMIHAAAVKVRRARGEAV